MNPLNLLSLLLIASTSFAAVLPLHITFLPHSSTPVIQIIKRVYILRLIFPAPVVHREIFSPCHGASRFPSPLRMDDKRAEELTARKPFGSHPLERGHGPRVRPHSPVKHEVEKKKEEDEQKVESRIASSGMTSHPFGSHIMEHGHGPRVQPHHHHEEKEDEHEHHEEGEHKKKELRKRDFGANVAENGHGPVVHSGATAAPKLEKRSVQEPMQVSSKTGGALQLGKDDKMPGQ